MTNYKDILDVQIQVKCDKNPRTVGCTKNKDGAKWSQRSFSITPVEGTESCTVEWNGAVPTKASKEEDQLEWYCRLVEEHPGLNQSEITGYAQNRKGWGRTITRDRLGKLVMKNRIKTKPGPKHSTLYVPV